MNVSGGGRFDRDGIVDVQLLRETSNGRSCWKLLHDVRYTNNRGVEVKVPAGFVTDFASVPRLFWRIVPPTGTHGAAAVVHDYLYFNHGNWNRSDVDSLFFECLEVLEVPRLKRTLMYLAVRIGGWYAWMLRKTGHRNDQ